MASSSNTVPTKASEDAASRIFSMRIVSLDYYMSPPIHSMDPLYSPFQGQPIAEVPVVRFYGPTPSGQKTCLHLHGAFPYLYVPYDDDLPENLNDGLAFVRRLASAVEKGLKMMNSIGARRQHVHSCSFVRAKKFYGFHPFEQLFMKLVLYHPQDVSRLSTLLLGGGILNRIFQPHESHIPYLLQVLVDYNLAGMGFVHMSNVKFREPLPDYPFIFPCPLKPSIESLLLELTESIAARNNEHDLESLSSSKIYFKFRKSVLEPFASAASRVLDSPMGFWLRKTIPEDWVWSVPPGDASKEFQLQNAPLFFRQSTCELEVDVSVENILNRRDLLHIALEKAGSDVKMVQSLIPIWEEEHARRAEKLATGDAEGTLSAERSFEVPLFETEYQKTFQQIMHKWLEKETEISRPCPKGSDIEVIHKDSAVQDDGLENLVNEEVVKSQLTQSSRETDKEAVELLRWMVHSQQDGGNSDSDNENIVDERPWSQNFELEDDALAKAILDYESFSLQECQEILDCSQDNQQNGTHSDDKMDAALLIPQLDGIFDEGFNSSEQQYSKEPPHTMETEVEKENLTGVGPLELSAGSTLHCINPCTSTKEPYGTHPGHSPLHSSSVEELVVPDLAKIMDIVKVNQLQHEQCDRLQEASDGHEEKLMSASGDEGEFSLRDLMRKRRKKPPPGSSGLDIYLSDEHIDGGNFRHDSLSNVQASKPEHSQQTISVEKEKCSLISADSSRKSKNKRHSRSKEPSSKYGALPIVKAEAEAWSVSRFLKHDEGIEVDGRHELRNPNITSTSEKAVAQQGTRVAEAVDYSDSSPPDEAYLPDKTKNLPIESRSLDVIPSEVRETSIHEDSPIPVHKVYARVPELTWSGSIQHVQIGVGNSHSTDTNMTTGISDADGRNYLCGMMDFSRSHGRESPSAMTFSRNQAQDNVGYGETKSSRCVSLDAAASNIDERKPFKFCKKPPSSEQLCASFDEHNLPAIEYDCVFYGNVEDLPAQPSLPAGSCIRVKSREIMCLPDYLFGTVGNEAGTSSRKELNRDYVLKDTWAPLQDNNPLTGLPVYFENDGTALFLITPTKAPPSQLAVCHWLQEQSRSMEAVKKQDSQDEVFIRDFPNIKVHPEGLSKVEACSAATSNLNIAHRSLSRTKISEDISQITTPTSTGHHDTPLSQSGFRDRASMGLGQKVLLMSIEVYAKSRGDLLPDPRYDAICCIVLMMESDDVEMNPWMHNGSQTIVLLHDANLGSESRSQDALVGCEVVNLKDEVSLLWMFIWLVCIYDPDILVGWEIQGFSLGLIAERASNLGIGLLRHISRTSVLEKKIAGSIQDISNNGENIFANGMDGENDVIIEDEWGHTHGSGIYVGGRVVLNLWRIVRSEVKLRIYTMEAVVEAVLKRKLPYVPWSTLSQWFSSGPGYMRFSCIEYFMQRATLNLQLIKQLDLINRTAELARVFGIDFFSVFSRGSQYRVESMMLRLAHTQNFLLIAPSRQQVAAQPAMECLPLVMEPESRFYTDPVVVLDFQSLYPSMIIAYNLCYSTCLGKIVSDNPKVFGVSSLLLENKSLAILKDKVTFTPNGVMYVPPEIRVGILPRLLQEILSTRIMVKRSIKELSNDQKVLQRVLNARQLALKLIANVTYGYTAAGFSGRMPCAELADSIVQYGRYTLERAINLVNSNPRWRAHVVYGDTDSMFVLLKGCTREQAFRIGGEIASSVTAMNPHPVTLKLEKVYHPCILLTKKRYVGYSFECAAQIKPTFDAKGIETVRRDTCTAVAKILERSLRVLFETCDLSLVKQYVQRQWGKISSGRISLRDFIFSKEVRLGTYSARASVLPPAAIVATKAMTADPRAEPHYAERIRYVVVYGEPGARLADMVVDPHFLVDPASTLRLHDTYYITKQIIPALQRVFGLVGIDLKQWYNEMPRPLRPSMVKRPFASALSPSKGATGCFEDNRNIIMLGNKKGQKAPSYKLTIDHYYLSQHCVLCGELIDSSSYVCDHCSVNNTAVFTALTGKRSKLERELYHLQEVCRHCGGAEKEIERGISCISLDCSVYYERAKLHRELKNAITVSGHCGFTLASFHCDPLHS